MRRERTDLGRLSEVDWLAVLYTDAFIFQTTKPPRRLYHLRQLAKLFLTHSVIPRGAEAEYLCFRSLDRADYKELFEAVIGTIPSTKLVVQDFRSRRVIPDIRPLLYLVLNLFLLPRLSNWPLKTRLYLYCRVAWYTALLKKIAKLRFKKLLVFADMQPLDNLLVQYFSEKSSITLQHGLYVDYKDSSTLNVANYRNQVANYFLAWGDDTASLINRYHPNTKVVVCGKPNLRNIARHNKSEIGEYFAVIFDQNMFEKYNFRLLDIAYKYSDKTGIRFYLKFHPWNYQPKYEVVPKYVVYDKTLESAKFVIGHTTSLLYELLRIGVPCYKLRSPEYALNTPDEVQFENAEHLHELSANGPNTESCSRIGKKFIHYYGKESIEAYTRFFTDIDETY